MCGIVCVFDLKEKAEILRPQILEMAKTIRHRGPDWSGVYSDDKAILAHERLAIVDPASGKQPLFSEDKKLILAAMVRYITTENFVSNFMENITFKLKVTAKLF